MSRFSNLVRVGSVALFALVILSGCGSYYALVARQPPAQYERLGRAEAEACGALVAFVIPIKVSSRVVRAYDAAVASVPGASGLVDVTVQDRWAWLGVGTGLCTKISGEAIR